MMLSPPRVFNTSGRRKQAQARWGSHPTNVLEQVERWKELRFHTDSLEETSFREALVFSSASFQLRAGAGYYQTP